MAIDLKSVRDRVRDLRIFLSVEDAISWADALANMGFRPPVAFVATARERAGRNQLGINTVVRQSVQQTISVAIVLGASRADHDRVDPMEAAREAVIGTLHGWRAAGADSHFLYDSFGIVGAASGLLIGEALFRADYHRTSVG